MKRRLTAVLVLLLVASYVCTDAQGHTGGSSSTNTINSVNHQYQTSTAIGGGNASSDSSSISWAGGGSADSFSYSEGSDSSAVLFYAPTAISNYKTRTPPLSTYPPYLPMWQHGGWGTVNAYFPNGPTPHDKVYERSLDPSSEADMEEIKGILRSLPYSGALEMIGGLLNGVTRLFGGPDQSHRGRGFEIANSVIRDRRPDRKPLLVFIDSSVDAQLLEEAGYAYVGRISLEGHYKRNWDHTYNAAIAEALPWDVDILLVSGGMKGVSLGTTKSLSAGGGYSQTDYSLSLMGGQSTGVTEGKGKAVMSATAYRYCPEMLERRRIPESLYALIRNRPQVAAAPAAAAQGPAGPAPVGAQPGDAEHVAPASTSDIAPGQRAGVEVSQDLYRMAFP